MDKLKEIPKEEKRRSNKVTDFLLLSVIMLLPLTAWAWADENSVLGTTLMLASAYVLSALVTSAHNYLHQADSWRMYMINFSGMTSE